MKIRLLIADDHVMFQEALSFWLRQHTDICIVGLAQDECIAVNLACDLRPDVVLMDVTPPGFRGIEAVREIVRKAPEVRVLVLSNDLRSQSVCDALCAGASGYVSKYRSADELVQAICCLAKEGTYIDPTIDSMIMCAQETPIRGRCCP